MKQIKILRTFVFAILLGTIVSIASSCSDDDETVKVGLGTLSGLVTDEEQQPIPGVTVSISGMEATVTTGADGKYTFPDVTMEKHAVSFTKQGFQTISATILASKFDGNKQAVIDIAMKDASSKIEGTLTDGKKGGAPLVGATVTLGTLTVTTGADGKYAFEYIATDDYTITFAKADYVSVTKTVSKDDFIAGVATLDLQMGGAELLREMTASDLAKATKWFYNEYRGGRNSENPPHWDWASDYMCTLDFWGGWEEQNEGTTLQIRNSSDQQKNPADLNVFDSYTYGSKLITADNKIMTVKIRTHNADDASPAYFGVQVIDLSASEPVAVKIGENKTHGSGSYADYEFDLSDYIGKEVIIAIGIFRKDTGDYWKQLVLRAIRFADVKVEGWNWLPGTELIEDWKMTAGMVRSTMPHTKKSFTGISPVSGNRDKYVDGYRAWRDVRHVGAEWSFMPLFKDPEVFGDQGYILKTRGNGAINTNVPESYLYSKFAIAAGSNKLTFKTRNYGSNYTFFKLTAIKEDGTVVYVAPQSHTATEASAAADGCWKFKHVKGDVGNPNDYATFEYDLSQFNGSNVVVAISVHNGEMNGDENKLVFYSIDLK